MVAVESVLDAVGDGLRDGVLEVDAEPVSALAAAARRNQFLTRAKAHVVVAEHDIGVAGQFQRVPVIPVITVLVLVIL